MWYLVGVSLVELEARYPALGAIEPNYFTDRWEWIQAEDRNEAIAKYKHQYKHWLTPDELPFLHEFTNSGYRERDVYAEKFKDGVLLGQMSILARRWQAAHFEKHGRR